MGWHIIGILAFVAMIIYRFCQEDKNSESRQETANEVYHQEEENSMEENLRTSEEELRTSEESPITSEEKPRTKELALSLLTGLGCSPKETEEGRIMFDFQGITFLMETVDECLFVNLIWPWCHSFSKFDIDEFARVRQVINDINMRGSATVFYGITDSDDVAVHIKKHFLLVPQIPHPEDYLKLMFDSFFRTARTLDVEIEKCRLQECE